MTSNNETVAWIAAHSRVGLPVTAGAVAISAFLPWLSVAGLFNINQSLIDGGDGWILLGGAALTALLSWKVKERWAAILVSLCTLALTVFETGNTLNIISGMTSAQSEFMRASLGYGAYLGIAAAAVLVVFAWVGREVQPTEKEA